MGTTMPTSSGWHDHPMIAAARSLAPAIAEDADQIEAGGRLTDAVAKDLTAAEIFQMYLPASFGGPEVEPLTGFKVCEELARVDASVGWCAQVSAAVTVFLAWLDPTALAEMVEISDGPLHVAGSARPLGRATRVDGGFRVTGHWNYASGVRHANWFLATSLVDRPDGSEAARSMLVPIADGEIVGNWGVVGMRGTGSDDFVLDDVFVPEGRVGSNRWITERRGSLYDPRLLMVATWAPTAGVGIGIAQGALDALIELGELGSTGSPLPLKTRAGVQQAVAEAETITGSARAEESIGAAWQVLLDDGPDLDRAVARAQLAITNTLNEAVRVADICFHAAGTNAISTANRLERSLRDAHTAVQHAAGQSIHQRVAARTLLGLDPEPADPARTGPTSPRT
jgi:indole-3-acetate monooxygenase